MADINKVVVLGAGIMGNGIAQVAAQAGFHVTMLDTEDQFIERGLATIRKSLSRIKRRGTITGDEEASILNRIKGSLDLKKAAGDADLVIEAVPEELILKQKTFRRLDEICPEQAILATNTSTISITAIASVTRLCAE